MPRFPIKLLEEWGWEGEERDKCTELVQSVVKKMRQMQADQDPVSEMRETLTEMFLEGIVEIYGDDWGIQED
jgi:hypothetical protein